MPGRSFLSSNAFRYGAFGYEKDNEVKGEGNSYTTEYRMFDPRLGRWLSVDPLTSKTPNLTPYHYCSNSPLVRTDPFGDTDDDITINAKGEVTKVVETDQPNRFFDEKGTELKFSDDKGLDSKMSFRYFEVGNKVFVPVSRKESQKALDDAGKIDFKKVNQANNVEMGIFIVRYWWASKNQYDFGCKFLGPKLKVTDQQYLEAYETTGDIYPEVPFIKFEGNNTIFNLPDAGNFLWGKKARDNNLPKSLMLWGAGANEGGEDTPADTKAILSGYDY